MWSQFLRVAIFKYIIAVLIRSLRPLLDFFNSYFFLPIRDGLLRYIKLFQLLMLIFVYGNWVANVVTCSSKLIKLTLGFEANCLAAYRKGSS